MDKLNSVESIDSSFSDSYLTENEFEEPITPLKAGLDVRKLTSGTEFCIKDDDDDDDDDPEKNNLNYFNNEELLKALNQECLYFPNEDDDENNNDFDDKTPFENMMKRMTPLVENQIFKKVLKTGFGTELPNKAFVTIHYNAYLEYNDEPFDSTRLRGTPLKFVLGDNRVIEGLDIAVATMKKGETSQFLIKSLYAYGEMGCPPRIPPSATILYEVELLHFLNSAPAIEYEELSPEEKKQLSFSERLKVVRSEHEAANDYFSRDNYQSALNKYKKAVKLIDNINVANEEEDNERNDCLLKLYLNISLCCIKQHEYKYAVIYAKKALNIDPKNTKGNYRCGKALRNLGDYAESKKYLQRARKCNPSNEEINEELKKLSSQEVRYSVLEKKFCKNIFKSSNKKDDDDDDDERPTFNYEVNDEFKAIVADCMKKFIDDKEQQEFPFGSGFSSSEIACLKDMAKEFGLYYVEQKNGPIKQMKVTKLKPSK
ncbi:inactive peptidyl-prolyl cis-trans isomerase FKBP6-like [Centruroides vittatus]|uniref:inactive peptidyl-prolyl cis-trans isomerase FKBP6-like n=1 Tax=Centruroides vittatus TaxID=120091 RepID=UPI00350F9DB5